jgi:hypothetical protein
MSRIASFLFAAALLLGADESWMRVKDLKSHSELRIYKKGAREPVIATFDEANDERILVVLKNSQVAIPKDDIDRIEARPAKSPRKVNVDSTVKQTDPDLTPHPNPGIPVPGTSSSSSVSLGGDSRPGFENIYRRPDGPSKK